ncbi:MAG: thioredoxin [Tatlockia sp.]|nr:thioredoxin [Tatlockia sp.]
MSINTLKTGQFDTMIATHELVFVDFWAEWCAPCKQFARVYEHVAKENPSINFTKVNIEEETELAENLQIRSIPHLMIFKQGILIYSEAGAMPESTLKDLVNQAITVDVTEIRAKIDKEED